MVGVPFRWSEFDNQSKLFGWFVVGLMIDELQWLLDFNVVNVVLSSLFDDHFPFKL